MDDKIENMANKIREKGGSLYLVGGAVRDSIIGIDVYDEDYCVTGLTEEEFISLFPDAISRGKSFKVFDLNGTEFALARKENKIGTGHKEFEITTAKDITIEEDLKRRDITINSIARDVLTGEIIDPFEGLSDIDNKVIRATSEAFKEDPLRAYRAARLACKLGFKIEVGTLRLMGELKNELSTLSAERVFDELRKALSYDKPSIFFKELKNANILDVHFSEVYKLIGAVQPEKYHPEGDAFNHTMLALDKCSGLTSDVRLRFAALVHDLGKGVTPTEEYPHHINHDVNGVNEVINLANRLKLPNDWKDFGIVAAREHMRAGIFNRMTASKKVSFIEAISKTKIGLDGMEIIVEADRNCRNDRSDKVEFAKIGEKLIREINGDIVKSQLKTDDGIKIKEKLHEQRVLKMKEWEIEES